mgnify:CR=1 FL=1
MPINIDELDADTMKKIGLAKPKNYTFLAEHERQYAIKALAVMTGLKQNERKRVLNRALKMNDV